MICVFIWLIFFFFSLLYLIFWYSTEDLTEKERILQAAECCRKILNHVNEEVKVMENLLVRHDPSLDAPIEHQLVSSKILFERAKGLYCFWPSVLRLWRNTSANWTHRDWNPVLTFILNIRSDLDRGSCNFEPHTLYFSMLLEKGLCFNSAL